MLSGILLIAGCLWMMPHGDFFDSQVFRHFWIGYGLTGMGYALSWRMGRVSPIQFWAIALLCRLFLLPMHPSDDIWRYLWEGLVQTEGISPYDFAPNAPELISYRTTWWASINHPMVSAIYPPITQWGFRGLATLASAFSLGTLAHVVLFKLAFVAADVTICYLLARRYGHLRALDYGWNPIVLYSFAGGGHYDSWFLLAVVLAWFSFDTRATTTGMQGEETLSSNSVPTRPAYGWSAFWIGISIAIKWISLPLLAFIGWRVLSQRQWIKLPLIGLLGTLPMVITALPFCTTNSCPLVPMNSVFVAYGRSAELVPHLVSHLWEPSRWENWLFAIPLSLWVGWLVLRSRSFLTAAEGYFTGLLLLSPIVHGWYFTWLVPFAVARRNWGTRLVSLSVSVYFALPYRQSLGNVSWKLRPLERVALWTPFIFGWLGSLAFQKETRSQISALKNNSHLAHSSDS